MAAALIKSREVTEAAADGVVDIMIVPCRIVTSIGGKKSWSADHDFDPSHRDRFLSDGDFDRREEIMIGGS